MNDNATDIKSNSAKKAAAAYNWCAVLLIIILLFIKGKIGVILTIGYPFLGIVILAKYRGLIKFLGSNKDNSKPQVAFGFIIPVVILVLWLKQVNIYRPSMVWIYTLVSSFLITIIVSWLIVNAYVINKKFYAMVIIIALYAGLYSYSSLVTLNVMFDTSKGLTYTTEITGKGKHHVRNSTEYDLWFLNWGPQLLSTRVDVNSTLYSRATIHERVAVCYKSGALGIPYYTFKLL